MIKYFIRLPFLKRLIPSITTRYFKLLKKNRDYFKVGNINFYLDYLDPIDRQIILNKDYENDLVFFLEKRMKEDSFSYFLDIGSNSGYYSFYFADKFKDLKVKAFEPNIDAYNKFKKTLVKNFLKNIEIFNFGLSDANRKVKIRSMIKNGFVQSNSAVLDSSHKFDLKDFEIKEATLKVGDDILNFRNEKLSIKIDVEGHEIYTLKGLLDILKHNKCLLLIEISDSNFKKVNNFLKIINYRHIFKFECKLDYIYTNFNSDRNQL